MKYYFYFFLLISVFITANSNCQTKNKNVNKNILIGQFTDCTVDEGSGDATGTGELKIEQKKGKYSGYFTQHYGTEGASFKKVPLTDLIINDKDNTISFKIKWFEEDNIKNPKSKVVTATGKFSKKGIALKFLGIYKDVLDVNLVSTKM
jgi:hypothetical protein